MVPLNMGRKGAWDSFLQRENYYLGKIWVDVGCG
jgi:hypothetical protein